ncbi:hypothetical protein Glove_86g164 [Diversispora epigaea]|uniref:Uncharacterized protein n=1 Tax=Diversispora epigaea TaxID=1348612 RepID=A0A397J7B3_9GLOM|nr:hypothetical protein Glove_86g164 [Diversispora epigaea]
MGYLCKAITIYASGNFCLIKFHDEAQPNPSGNSVDNYKWHNYNSSTLYLKCEEKSFQWYLKSAEGENSGGHQEIAIHVYVNLRNSEKF